MIMGLTTRRANGSRRWRAVRDARRLTREVLRVESWRLGAIPDQIRQPLNARCPATRAKPMLRNFTAGGWAVRMHSLLRGAHALGWWQTA